MKTAWCIATQCVFVTLLQKGRDDCQRVSFKAIETIKRTQHCVNFQVSSVKLKKKQRKKKCVFIVTKKVSSIKTTKVK